jgi:AcrR family transcriptional regulator
MSPRPYRLGKREEAISERRRRILDAARELLRVSTAYPGFTVDAVARRADMARGTVYYQFGSKTGLLEAVCDDLAEAGA